MRRPSLLSAFLLGSTLLLLPASAVRGQVVLGSQTVSFTNQALELNGSPSLAINRYSGTGTLTRVDIDVLASVTGSGTVTNTAAQAQTFTVSQTVYQFDLFAASGAPAALLSYTDPNSGQIGALSPFFGQTLGSRRYTALASNTPAAWGPFTINGAAATATFTGAGLAGFTGTGSFAFNPFTSVGTAIAGGGGNVATNILDLGSASVTITYWGTTAAVPEPSTWLSGSLVAGVCLIRAGWARRRRAAL